MTFTIRGVLTVDPGGSKRSIAWSDGSLTGDLVAIGMLEYEAVITHGQEIGPIGGPTTFEDHLTSGLSTVFLALRVFVDPEFGGTIPQRPALSPGFIG